LVVSSRKYCSGQKNDMKNGNFFLTFFHNVVNLSIDNFSDGVVSVC